MASGAVVIAGGGGGIPVVRDARGDWQGVQAVVDKDLTSALLAASLGIPDLLILTTVDQVAINFGKPTQTLLSRVKASELRAYQRAGHFARGSMGPKVEAALRHIEGGGRRAIIAHLSRACFGARRRERHACGSRLASRVVSRAKRWQRAKARSARYSGAASTSGSKTNMRASATRRSAAGRSTRWSRTSASRPSARPSRSPPTTRSAGSPRRAATDVSTWKPCAPASTATCRKKAWVA